MKKQTKTILLKVTDSEWSVLQEKAKTHTDHNVSAWIRHAAKVYTPKEGERVPSRHRSQRDE